MPKLQASQIRSGEGWILTRFSNIGIEAVPDRMGDLLVGPLLVSSPAFASWTPPGGEKVDDGLWSFSGEHAKALLREPARWANDGAIVACLPRMPDADARRRWIPDPMRPWDPERLGATFYAQVGRRHAIRGIWFARERDRARFVELAVTDLLAQAGVRLPNGDVTIVLDMPTDSTFDAEYAWSGRGESFSMKRRFPTRMLVRQWFVRRGEWEAVDKRTARSEGTSLRERTVRFVATAGIFVLSLPVFALVALVALVTKLSGASTTVSKSAPPRAIR